MIWVKRINVPDTMLSNLVPRSITKSTKPFLHQHVQLTCPKTRIFSPIYPATHLHIVQGKSSDDPSFRLALREFREFKAHIYGRTMQAYTYTTARIAALAQLRYIPCAKLSVTRCSFITAYFAICMRVYIAEALASDAICFLRPRYERARWI